MKEIFIASVLATLLVTQVFSEEKRYETLLGYKNVVVKKVLKDGIRVMYSGGFVKIAIEDLPEEVREELGMSMEGVEDYRKQEAAEAAARSKQLRARAKKRAVVTNRKKLLETTRGKVIEGVVQAVNQEGCLIDVYIWEDGHIETYRPNRVEVKERKRVISYKKYQNRDGSYEVFSRIFIKCKTDGLSDGLKISNSKKGLGSWDIWPIGTYSYKTPFCTKTVRAFTTDSSDQKIAVFKNPTYLLKQRIKERSKKGGKSTKIEPKTLQGLRTLSVMKDGLLVQLQERDRSDIVFVSCPSEGFTTDREGSIWATYFDVWQTGTYSYTNGSGATKTVPKLTVFSDDEDIIEWIWRADE
ncbi:hypothetical protein N8549_00285 [bacterium]|nr:hypothetical protein [bacterium]